METIDELTVFLSTATTDGILGRLLYRGAAWSLMRVDGVLPPNAPPLGATIATDLAEHGFALLRGAMALRVQAGASELTSKAFERAANAFEALVRNDDPEAPDRGFRSSFHPGAEPRRSRLRRLDSRRRAARLAGGSWRRHADRDRARFSADPSPPRAASSAGA